MNQNNRRVVVTGMGAVSPVGNDVQTSWENLISGVHGIGPITRFDTTEYKAKLAAEVKDFDARKYMEKAETLRSDLYAQYALASACQAVEESGVLGTVDPERFAVYFGTGIGGINTFSREYKKLLDRGPSRVSPYFIPMLIGLGCGVPAVQASRTIENDRDRKMTIMTTTFIPCSAKLPIIGLISGALFHGSGWVATSAYFVGIAAIIVSGIMLKKTKLFAGDPAPFVMELPAYHIPSAKGVLLHMWDRSKAFVRKAGTVIFLSCALIWFLSSFNFSLQMVETPDSMLASIGKVIAPLFAPLGWGHWEAAVGSFAGLVAKENLVSTMGILYGFAEVAENGDEMWSVFAHNFTVLSAYSFLVFNLLCAPCFAAIGAIRREMGSGKWTWIAIGYQCIFAYIVSLMIYQLGNWFVSGTFGLGTLAGIILLAAIIWLLVRPNPTDKKLKNMKSAKTMA